MRVTWLCLEWPRVGHHAGGVGRYVERLAEQMREVIDLRVVAFDGARPLDGVDFDLIEPATSRLDRYYGAPWRAARAVRCQRPDIVHAHGDDLWLPRGIPIVRTFHGSAWNEARTSAGLRRLNHLALALAEDVSARRADVRLGISPESAKRFRCHHVVPPYIASAEMVEGERRPTGIPSVLFIGSYDGRKRGRLVQEAVAALRGESAVSLTVIGPPEDRDRWAQWVDHRSGLSDSEVRGVLARSWLLAAPSSYEGFGIPVLEALDCGVRIVAFRNPGTEYLTQRGQVSLPLRLSSPQTFEHDLSVAIGAPDLTSEEMRAARTLVRDISAEGSVARLLQIYEAMVG